MLGNCTGQTEWNQYLVIYYPNLEFEITIMMWLSIRLDINHTCLDNSYTGVLMMTGNNVTFT